MNEKINSYYENYDEEGRLFRDKAHLPEWLTTIRYFDRLFKPGSQILDACAGAGRYSFYFAAKGHIVTACDIAEHNVNVIRANPNANKLADIKVCNVLDLSQFDENSFDVVLCMGALYHLQEKNDRIKAVSECVRICKPGGIVALAYITKIGVVYMDLNEDISNISELLNFINGKDESVFVPTASNEIEAVALSCGLKKLHNIGTDGLVYAAVNKLNKANDDDFQKYMEFHYSICEDADVVGASLHGLWIGRKI